MHLGPIIIIDDDVDDKEMLEEILAELNVPNETVWFTKTKAAFDYLIKTGQQPFVIFSDINLPEASGLDFKKQIDDDPVLKKKSIPFIFFSTAADPTTINDVYSKMTVQGYFQKPNTYAETRDIVRRIIEYWKVCKHPNSSAPL